MSEVKRLASVYPPGARLFWPFGLRSERFGTDECGRSPAARLIASRVAVAAFADYKAVNLALLK